MIALEKSRRFLENLWLGQAAAVLDSRLEAAAQKQMPYADFLADLLDVEASARNKRRLDAKTKLAHFPYKRTLGDFDFAFQPSVDERLVRELGTLAFVAEAANVILLGPPGVGKTHLAVALGLQSIENGYGVYFVRTHDLLEDLGRAAAEHQLGKRRHFYLRPKVLIMDEFGVWPCDRHAATALFALVSARCYEHGSIILTSNKGFTDWGTVLGDNVTATAILDRLLHQAQVLNIRGESASLREKKRAGSPAAPPPQEGVINPILAT